MRATLLTLVTLFDRVQLPRLIGNGLLRRRVGTLNPASVVGPKLPCPV